MNLAPLAAEHGGADLTFVYVGADGKPWCREHGALNKVSPSPPGIWRCLGGLVRCPAGCQEVDQQREAP